MGSDNSPKCRGPFKAGDRLAPIEGRHHVTGKVVGHRKCYGTMVFAETETDDSDITELHYAKTMRVATKEEIDAADRA